MASYNRIIIIGNLTRDPEYKQVAGGQPVCRLGLASNRQFKSRQSGQAVQEVCFVDVDVWGQQAESCRQYLSKGRSVLIEGRLKYDTWQDPDGQRRSKHSIVADRVTFMGSGAGADEASETEGAEQSRGFTPADSPSRKSAVKRGFDSLRTGDAIPEMGEVAFGDEKPFEDDLPF